MIAGFSLVASLVERWASLYAESSNIETAVSFVHIGGLVFAGGLAIASDRSALRAHALAPTLRTHVLDEIHRVHRPVLIGLAMTMLSGMLLLLADTEALLGSVVFWVKMALVGLLAANGAWLTRLESGLRAGRLEPATGWRRLRRSAQASITLWFLIVLLGSALLNS